MANELEHLDMSGLTIYAKPLPIVASPWGDDAVAMTETGTTGYYSADVASPANRYAVYQQAGASPAATDVAVATIAVVVRADDRDGEAIAKQATAATAAAQSTAAASQTTATAIRGAVGPMVATVARPAGSNVLSPIPRAGQIVVHHPTDAGKVRQWTGTGAPQWVELATATFSECAVTLEQIGTTGIYYATLDVPDDATYPVHLYATDATAFDDQVIAQMTWYPEPATSGQVTAIKAKTDNLPDEPASKGDVQVTVEGGDATAAKQDQLIALFQSGLPDVGPGQQRGARRVVKGDTYSATGRQSLITKHKNADWPTDLSEWTWAFTASKHPDNENDGDALAGSVDVVTATGDSRGLRINHTKAQTLAAAVGRHLYAVRGTNSGDSSIVWTVELGVVDVEEAAAG